MIDNVPKTCRCVVPCCQSLHARIVFVGKPQSRSHEASLSESRSQFAMVSEFLKNEVILGDQRRRLVTLLDGGEITKAKREPIPYQTKSAKVPSGGAFSDEVFFARVFLKTHQNT